MSKIVNRENLKAFRQKLDDKYVIEGEYSPETKVGYADESGALTPYGDNSGANDTTPFVFQSTGGSSDVGSKAYLRVLRGNSVAWNQLCNSTRASTTSSSITITNNADGSFTFGGGTASGNITFEAQKGEDRFDLIAGHKYLIRGCPSGGGAATYDVRLSQSNMVGYDYGSGLIGTALQSGLAYVLLTVRSGVDLTTSITFKPQIFDLTLMFGAGNEPTSVLEFNRLFPKPYYAYNAGALLSCKVNGIKNVMYNAFDGELEQGDIIASSGQNGSGYQIRSKNYIKVLAGQNYTFEYNRSGITTGSTYFYLYEYDANLNYLGETISANSNATISFTLKQQTCYVRFKLYNSNDFSGFTPIQEVLQCCLHLTWDGSKTGYEEYYTETYALPNVELRSAGSIYDELKPDGTLIRRIGSYTFTGNETWTQGSTSGSLNRYRCDILQSLIKKPTSNDEVGNAKSDSYIIVADNSSGTYGQKQAISISTSGSIYVFNSSIQTSDGMASAMSGKTIYYELATPTTEQTDNTFQESTKIDDYGTQEFLSSDSIVIPQGNEFFYPVDYKAFIDSLGGRDDIEYAADQVVSQTQLANYLKTISGYDATKTQTLKNVNGTFTWVDDE